MARTAPEGSLVALLLHEGTVFTNGMDSGVPCVDPTRFYLPENPLNKNRGEEEILVVGYIKKYDEKGALMASTADPLNTHTILKEREEDCGILNMWYVNPEAVKK